MSSIAAALDAGSKIDLLMLSVGVAVITVTLTRSHLTKTLRHRFIDAPFMIGELINCPYCMAHWVSLGASMLLGGGMVTVLVNAAILTGLACGYIGVLMRLWFMQETELENLRELLLEAQAELSKRA
jgi:Protein of unknown function (DUF1360)